MLFYLQFMLRLKSNNAFASKLSSNSFNVWPIQTICTVSLSTASLCFSLTNFFIIASTVIAQRGYFKDQTFINYLKYLLYWKEPEYARYIKYPMCLYFLDLLQYEPFRREIVNSQCVKFIDDQAVLMWQHYTRRRMKLLSMHNGNAIANGHQQQNGSPSSDHKQSPNENQLMTTSNGAGGGVGGTETASGLNSR